MNNDVWCEFGDRKMRMEKLSSGYLVTWYKPKDENGSVMQGSTISLSDEAMHATINCYLKLNEVAK